MRTKRAHDGEAARAATVSLRGGGRRKGVVGRVLRGLRSMGGDMRCRRGVVGVVAGWVPLIEGRGGKRR